MLIKEKINQAKALLGEFGLDCWITFVRESAINGDPVLAFVVGSDVTWHSAFIVTRSGRTHAIVGRYDKRTVEELGAYDEVVGFVEGIKEPLQSFLREVNPAAIGLNFSEGSEICDGLTHGMYLTLKAMLNEVGLGERIVSSERIVSALRERKSPAELGYIRQAIRHTQEIFDLAAGFIAPGKTERQIAEFMLEQVHHRGLVTAWGPATCPSVFTGPETAEAHYAPTDRPVERGQVLNMDFGVKVNGYCSDMQRTFYIMEEGQKTVPEPVQRGFATIVEAVERPRQAMMPGVKGLDVDAVAREVLASRGYEGFPHGLGHQVGRFPHDGTALLGPAWEKYAQKPFQRLEPNMVFTLEPRLTVPDRGVVTIEEMVVVTEHGAEYLSDPQKEIIIIH